MKDLIKAVAIFALILLFIPLVMVITGNNVNNHNNTYAVKDKTIKSAVNDITFKVRDSKTGDQSIVDGFEFICGVVAGEMPSSYDEEALKAQAVASFSYCCYLREHPADGTYITTGKDVAYLSRDSAKKLWGAKFESWWNKIEGAVQEVYGKGMFFDGKVIEANYCDMSSGITESCKDVYGNELPYLVEVASESDRQEKNYLSHVTLTLEQFKEKVSENYPEIKFEGSPEKYISDIKRSDAGGIISAALCGESVTGRDIRGIFGLRSTNFTLLYKDGRFTFEVKGYGHGVGMSQCGAQHMAAQGKSWQDILEWYYKGIIIGNYFS